MTHQELMKLVKSFGEYETHYSKNDKDTYI